MHFVLSDQFLTLLQSVRADYISLTKTNLDSEGPNRFSMFLGAKDVKTRNKQINFIEQWLIALDKELHPERLLLEKLASIKGTPTDEHSDLSQEEKSISEEQMIQIMEYLNSAEWNSAMEEKLTSLQVLVTIVLYINSQIDPTYYMRSPENAVLTQLLNKCLGITQTNIFDEDTRACCLLAAKRLLNEKGRFEAVNALIEPRFSEKEWDGLLNFVISQCDGLHPKYKQDFPIMHAMKPLLGKPLELAGYTTGYIMGEMVGKSTKLVRSRLAITAFLSSSLLYFMGPPAAVGIMLLAPTYADRIVNTFCGITFAWVLGQAGSIAGQGIGMGLGLSLDLSWKLVSKTCNVISQIYSTGEKQKPSGVCLVNGHYVIDGIEVQQVDPSVLESLRDCNMVHVEANNDALEITYNGEKTTLPWKGQTPAYLEELKKVLLAHQTPMSEPLSLTDKAAVNDHVPELSEFLLDNYQAKQETTPPLVIN
ncbi:hypothetical protein [Legionella jordanis]|uniref:Substrate of the Dot/Icm secretion system n=1 Tax=Legionella jordanis TaxID=456 RepID=A0A0W0V865_9GAMM|nr:hypothetical protein [Legionella jordanis]KTD16325.1 substrate of the Dot/Icm secretion system [Legionella jordanis]RMX04462.1 hypothetical protein EAW55_03235 [Legionella jordanis]RMX21007.1 hypothetical protein EAS68_04690 [Legionella jordanis]VEH12217.1 Dot/Icm secretion system substrate [Legionella jordanis]